MDSIEENKYPNCEYHPSQPIEFINLDCKEDESVFICSYCEMGSERKLKFLLPINKLGAQETDDHVYFKSPWTTKTQMQQLRKYFSQLKPVKQGDIESLFIKISSTLETRMENLKQALIRHSNKREQIRADMFEAYNTLIGKQTLKKIINDKQKSVKEKDHELKALFLQNKKDQQSKSFDFDNCLKSSEDLIFQYETCLSLTEKITQTFVSQLDNLLNMAKLEQFCELYKVLEEKIDSLMLEVSNKFNEQKNECKKMKNHIMDIDPEPPIQTFNSRARQEDDNTISKCRQLLNLYLNNQKRIKVLHQVKNMTFGQPKYERKIGNNQDSLILSFNPNVWEQNSYLKNIITMNLEKEIGHFNKNEYACRVMIKLPTTLKELPNDAYFTIGFQKKTDNSQRPITFSNQGILFLDAGILEPGEFEKEESLLEIRWVPFESEVYIETKSKYYKVLIKDKKIDSSCFEICYAKMTAKFQVIFWTFQVIQKENTSMFSNQFLL